MRKLFAVALAAGVFCPDGQSADDPKAQAIWKTNTLRIVVKTSKTIVRVKEEFRVGLRVENVSATNQNLRVMNCSWDEHWKTSNRNIAWIGHDCAKNFEVSIDLAPGAAYTNQMEMFVPQPVSQGTISFQMGFTPIGATNTIWSETVVLRIVPSAALSDLDDHFRWNGLTNSPILHEGMKLNDVIKILGPPTHHMHDGRYVEGEPQYPFQGWLRWYHNPREIHVAPSIGLRIENGVVKEVRAGRG